MRADNIICLFIIFICVAWIVGIIGSSVYAGYKYDVAIGSYFENAEDCITPDCILDQLNQGKLGMINEGLTADLYGAWMFKKPDNSMTFQYQHLDSIIERAEAVKAWKVQMYSESSSGETMKDVYNEKMDNLRNYITAEGYRSDWIASDAWWLKNHRHLAIFGFWEAALAFILGIIAIVYIANNQD
jgi:hypothetical protein